jgi:hypothetical protein
MKKLIIPFFIVLFFTSCPPDEIKTIENVYCRTIERNYSTYNLFVQYYLKDGTITRKKIYKSTENRIDHILSDDYINRDEMYENNYYMSSPDYDPQIDGLTNPNKQIKKILFIDIDTNKILKHLEYNKNWYFLGFADYNWDMRTKWEYWILDITNEWLLD